MKPSDDEQREDLLIGLLADYDEALAAHCSTETVDSTAAELDPQTAAEWTELKRCVTRLEQMRRGSGLPNLSPATPTPDRPEVSPHTPRRVGRFILERELGRGGLGIVYLAHDPRLGRKVALKIPRLDALWNEELQRRFVREAEAAARLDHPHLVSLHEVGEDGGICYLAMEYRPGPTLTEWLRKRSEPVPCREAAEIVLKLAEGVEHAHSRGVLHRDIKPSNVLLDIDGDATACSGRWSPKLTDFGMTKLLEQKRGDTTRSGAVLGTLAYMAPEQIEGRVDMLDVGTDVYGLGALLYELLTGAAPHGGQTDLDTLRNLIANEPLPPRKLRRDVPRDLEAITIKCLAKKPAARYATAHELAADLRRFRDGRPTEARPVSLASCAIRWVRRRPAIAALWLVSAAAISTIAAINAWRIEEVTTAQTLVQHESQRADHETAAKRRLLYASQMRRAQEAWRDGNLPLMRDILHQYAAGSPDTGLRHFEWHHLNYLANLPHRVLRGHVGEVYGVAYSRDGKILLTGGQDGTVRLWDPSSGQELAVLREHTSCVNDIDFSPDGDTFVTSSCDKTIKLWSLSQRQVLATLNGHTQEVEWCAFIEEGRMLASLSYHITGPREARIWDVASKSMRTDWPPAGDGTQGFVRGRTGRTLVTFANDQATVWRRDKDSWLLSHRTDRLHPSSMAILSPDEDYMLVSAWPRGDVQMFRLQDSLLMNSIMGHIATVNAIAISSAGDRLASASTDGTVRVFDFPSGRPQQSFLGHQGRVWRVAWAPNEKAVASAGSDGTVRIWDFQVGWSPMHLNTDTAAASCQVLDFAYLKDGQHVNAALTDGSNQTWNIKTAQTVSPEQTPGTRLHGNDPIPPNSRFQATSHALLPQWNPQACSVLSRLHGQSNTTDKYTVNCARLLVDLPHIAEVARGQLLLWSMEPLAFIQERELSEFTAKPLVCDISPNGQQASILLDNGRIGIRGLTGSTSIDLDERSTGDAARFSPDGKRILVRGTHLNEYDARTGDWLRELVVEGPGEFCYSADSQRIAVSSWLGYVAIFDAITGEETLRLDTRADGCSAIVFADDGTSLLMRDQNGNDLLLWQGSCETSP
jgi:WD40 repeat protein